MVYRCLHGQAPRYLADHLITSSDVASRLRLRSANRHQLIVARCRLNTYGRRAFSIAGPTVSNSLPDEFRDPACDSDSFKQFTCLLAYLLTYLLTTWSRLSDSRRQAIVFLINTHNTTLVMLPQTLPQRGPIRLMTMINSRLSYFTTAWNTISMY